MSFSIKKPFKLTTIGNEVNSATKTYTLLPNFVGNSESYARSWLASNGLSASVSTKEVSSGYYDGQVISQSYPSNKRTDLISGSVGLTVAKVIKTTTPSTSSSNNNSSSNSNSSNKNTDKSSSSNSNNTNKENNNKSDSSSSGSDNKDTTLPPEIID